MQTYKVEHENLFSTLTDRYDTWYESEKKGRLLYESELKCIKPMVEKVRCPILEIGVGTGRFAMHFSGTIGTDPALNALKKAKSRGVKTVQARGETLPFGDKSFNTVLIIITLSFVENPLPVLKEAKRVVEKSGTIIIGFIQRDSPWGILYSEKKRLGRPFYNDARFYTFEDIKRLLHESGLRIIRTRSTLLRRPDEPRMVEETVEGYVKRAGFICIKVKQ